MVSTRWKNISIVMLLVVTIVGAFYLVIDNKTRLESTVWQPRDFYTLADQYLKATEPANRNSSEFEMLTSMMLLTGDDDRAEQLINRYRPDEKDPFAQGQFFIFLVDTILGFDPNAAQTAEALLIKYPYPYLISSQLKNITKAYLKNNQPAPLFVWLSGTHGQLLPAEHAEIILQLVTWYGEQGKIAQAEELIANSKNLPVQARLHFALAFSESIVATHPELAIIYANKALQLLPLAQQELKEVQIKNRLFRIAHVLAQTGPKEVARVIMNRDIQPYLEKNIINNILHSQKEWLLYKQLNDQEQIKHILNLAADDFHSRQDTNSSVVFAKDYAQLLSIFEQTSTINQLIDEVWYNEKYSCHNDINCIADKASLLAFQPDQVQARTKITELINNMPPEYDNYLAIIASLAQENRCETAEQTLKLLRKRFNKPQILDSSEKKVIQCYLGLQKYKQALTITERYANEHPQEQADLLLIAQMAINHGDIAIVERIKNAITNDEQKMALNKSLVNYYAQHQQIDEFYQAEQALLLQIKQLRKQGQTTPYPPHTLALLGYLHKKYHLPIQPQQQELIDYLFDNTPPASKTMSKEALWQAVSPFDLK